MSHERSSHSERHRFTRRTFLRAALGSIGVASTGLLSACGSMGSASDKGKDYVIEMNDAMMFDPNPATISVGTTITFTNASSGFVHTATCDPALAADPTRVLLPDGAVAWNSGNIQPGESWSMRFETPGEYHYVCLPHELAGMTGTIVVEDD